MAQETVPGAVASDDNLRIAFVPGVVDATSAATLTGATTKDITYSLKAFNRTITEATIDDPRLTLKQVLQQPGRITETLEIQSVFGGTDDVAKVALAEGTLGSIVARYAVANADDWTVGDIVDVIPVRCGRQRKDAPTENGVWTFTQTLFVTDVTKNDVPLVA
jgi:hypothetical protein